MVGTKQGTEKFTIASDAPGHVDVLLGNEAIARGIIEAGTKVVAAYPGTPSSEILDSLSKVARKAGIYTEWSINEKVAAEVATAASIAGLRAATPMKAQGMNVALDFIAHGSLTQSGDGGLLIIVCDDPHALSSNNEQDSRWFARMFDYPLLEPSSPQEGKDMALWAFDLSEQFRTAVFLRSVTRISHSSGLVTMGNIQHLQRKAHVDATQEYLPFPVTEKHARAKRKLGEITGVFNNSPFNWYHGAENPRLVVVCSGTGWLCAREAVEILGLTDTVGIIKLGTTWPLPMDFIKKHLAPSCEILVIEEIDPFIETHLRDRLYSEYEGSVLPKVYGKTTGHMNVIGELNPDHAIQGIAKALGIEYQSREAHYDIAAKKYMADLTIPRDLVYCPGCPHRASLWILKNILMLSEDTDRFINGDIGCYGLDWTPGGQMITRNMSAMGSASGLASGFGKFEQFGFDQIAVATIGDSTFFHAAIPPIINAVHHKSNALFLVMDNSATAMTGFQPHPGIPVDSMGEEATPIDIETLCRSLGCTVAVADPFDLEDARAKLNSLVEQDGAKVMIMRRACGLVAFRTKGPQYKTWVNQDVCIGEECGCDRYCNRIFKCPALVWDQEKQKARIDEALCTGCGFCVNVCPRGAIVREKI